MSDLLYTPIVLVLNRNWQAIDVKTPADAFCMLAAGNASALEIEADANLQPTSWENWLKLGVRPQDHTIGTVHGAIRIPTVIVLKRYSKIPKRHPRLSMQGIWERDGGVCQYTGRQLRREEGNIDHVLPKSRGGITSWENCVLADKKVNSKKADRSLEESGLKLLKKPIQPRSLPSSYYIRNHHQVKDWELFLHHG